MDINQLGFGVAYISLLILLAAREMVSGSESRIASRSSTLVNTLFYINVIVFGLFLILFILETSRLLS